MKKQTLTLSRVALAAFVGLLAGSCGKQASQGSAPAPQIAVMTIEPTSAAFQNSYPATIKGKTDIDIRPQVSGFITKVHVDEGQRVRKGQTLFTIDQVQFQAAVDQARANVNSAQTAVSTAELTEKNKKMLLDKNIISQTDWQLAANQVAQAKAALAQAQAALVTAQKNLTYTVVTSPSDGVVGVIPNREGALVSPSGQALTTVSDNSDVYAYFSLTEKELLDLANAGAGIGQMPEVKLELADGSIYPYSGKVSTVSGVIDNSTGSASARALFSNPDGLLRSGNTGQIIVPRNSENVIVIPQKATQEIQDMHVVYVLNDSNVVVARPITIDPYNDGKSYVVTSGLEPGERIAVEGVGNVVRNGVTITPKTAEAAQ